MTEPPNEAPPAGRARRTRERIRERAMELFMAQGYDHTTVSEIAEAAGVSQMTLFRHFPTKSDLVCSDEYDPVMARSIAQQPRRMPPLKRIHLGVRSALEPVYRSYGSELLARASMILSTPVLAKRVSDGLLISRAHFEAALAEPREDGERGEGEGVVSSYEIGVAAAVACACLNTALTEWAARQGVPDLLQLVDSAFETIYRVR